MLRTLQTIWSWDILESKTFFCLIYPLCDSLDTFVPFDLFSSPHCLTVVPFRFCGFWGANHSQSGHWWLSLLEQELGQSSCLCHLPTAESWPLNPRPPEHTPFLVRLEWMTSASFKCKCFGGNNGQSPEKKKKKKSDKVCSPQQIFWAMQLVRTLLINMEYVPNLATASAENWM